MIGTRFRLGILFLFVALGVWAMLFRPHLPNRLQEWEGYIATSDEVEVEVYLHTCEYLEMEFGQYFVTLLWQGEESDPTNYPCEGRSGSVFRFVESEGAGIVTDDGGNVYIINYLVTVVTEDSMTVTFSSWRINPGS